MHRVPPLVLIVLVSALAACAGRSDRAEVIQPPQRDEALARMHLQRGVEAMRLRDFAVAEAAFLAALEADAFSGVAHNNLGKVYYHQHRLYEAAQRFEYAARLLPHHPEPRNNLGLVLEAAGRLDEAIDEYRRALHARPDSPQLLGNLLRARVRRGDEGPEMVRLFSELVMKETRPTWRRWAKAQLAQHGALPEPDAAETAND